MDEPVRVKWPPVIGHRRRNLIKRGEYLTKTDLGNGPLKQRRMLAFPPVGYLFRLSDFSSLVLLLFTSPEKKTLEDSELGFVFVRILGRSLAVFLCSESPNSPAVPARPLSCLWPLLHF